MKPSTYFTILALIINVSLKCQVIHKKGEIIDVRDGKVRTRSGNFSLLRN